MPLNVFLSSSSSAVLSAVLEAAILAVADPEVADVHGGVGDHCRSHKGHKIGRSMGHGT